MRVSTASSKQVQWIPPGWSRSERSTPRLSTAGCIAEWKCGLSYTKINIQVFCFNLECHVVLCLKEVPQINHEIFHTYKRSIASDWSSSHVGLFQKNAPDSMSSFLVNERNRCGPYNFSVCVCVCVCMCARARVCACACVCARARLHVRCFSPIQCLCEIFRDLVQYYCIIVCLWCHSLVFTITGS